MGVALFSAGRYSNTDNMQWLLENGSDIKASGLWSHETVFQVAACPIYADKIRLLLSDIKARGLFKRLLRYLPRSMTWSSIFTPCIIRSHKNSSTKRSTPLTSLRNISYNFL
jgi:hypothetical protein